MMSMSDNREEMTAGEWTWEKYEITTFEPSLKSDEEKKSDFLTVQTGEENAEIFTLFQEYSSAKDRRSKIDEILEKARERAVSIEREAYEEGFAQGEKDGLELGKEKAKKIVGSIEDLLHEINRLKGEIARMYEKEILEVIVAITKKIIHIQTGMNEKTVRDTIINAVKYATEKSDITLRISPDDFEYVENLRPDLFAELKELKSMMVTADPSITRGGCLVESSHGNIDARIETQLEKIHQCLEEAGREKEDA